MSSVSHGTIDISGPEIAPESAIKAPETGQIEVKSENTENEKVSDTPDLEKSVRFDSASDGKSQKSAKKDSSKSSFGINFECGNYNIVININHYQDFI